MFIYMPMYNNNSWEYYAEASLRVVCIQFNSRKDTLSCSRTERLWTNIHHKYHMCDVDRITLDWVYSLHYWIEVTYGESKLSKSIFKNISQFIYIMFLFLVIRTLKTISWKTWKYWDGNRFVLSPRLYDFKSYTM